MPVRIIPANTGWSGIHARDSVGICRIICIYNMSYQLYECAALYNDRTPDDLLLSLL